MARPRSYVQDFKGKTVDGLSFHKPSGRYYSIDKDRQRKYWGRDKDRAIDRYRASLKLWPLRQTTDEEAICRLVEEGVDEDGINPELIRMAKQNRFVFNNDWIDANPDAPLAIFAKTGKMPRRPKPKPQSKVNPDGIRLLTQVGSQWESDKKASPKPPKNRTIRDYLHDWKEFVAIARRQSVLDIADVNKAFIRTYREKIITAASGSGSYYSSRFRRVKAILRHILTEHDVAGVTEERAGYLRDALRMLRATTARGQNRPITPEELHALLKVCDDWAAIDALPIEREIESHTCRRCDPTKQRRCGAYQRLLVQLQQARKRQFFGIQFRAIYLVAVNHMFYPVDLSSIPRSATNFDNGHVKFRRGKTDTVRVGVLLPVTIDAIKAWLVHRQDNHDLLFVNTASSPWTTKALGKRFTEHKRLAGLTDDGLTLKAFRKGGYEAALRDPHVDLYTAKILAGHATGITDSYVDANPERCRLAVESIGRVYGLLDRRGEENTAITAYSEAFVDEGVHSEQGANSA